MRGLFAELEQPSEHPAVVLRPYQEKAAGAVLEALDRGVTRAGVVMPTGCGKTTVFGAVIGEFSTLHGDEFAGLVLAHRIELLEQASGRIFSQNPNLLVSIESGSQHAVEGADVVVAGVQSIGRENSSRLSWLKPSLMVIDEMHHAPAASYQIVMRRFGSYEGSCFTLGVTATDHRMDNKPLSGGRQAIFEEIVFRYSIRDAIKDGWLCDLRGYRVKTDVDLTQVKTVAGEYHQGQLADAVNTNARNSAACKHWAEIASDRRTIVFCVDVQHAKDAAKAFRDRGVAAEHVDGGMKQDERESVIRRFRHGETQVLTNVEIATEGFDCPEIACVLLLRPTKSWTLFTQMVGRGLRLNEGKRDCIVVDFVDNTEQHKVGVSPESNDRPGIAGLVGLPAQMDLQGHTLIEAVELFEIASAPKRGKLFMRECSFEDLATGIHEVDLLEELETPESILKVSRLAWMKVGDGVFYLNCGSARDASERDRYARITVDQLGNCIIQAGSSTRKLPEVKAGDDIEGAFKAADGLVQKVWPDCLGVVAAKAKWRDRTATPAQLNYMRKLGVPSEYITSEITTGQASRLITVYQQRVKSGRRSR